MKKFLLTNTQFDIFFHNICLNSALQRKQSIPFYHIQHLLLLLFGGISNDKASELLQIFCWELKSFTDMDEMTTKPQTSKKSSKMKAKENLQKENIFNDCHAILKSLSIQSFGSIIETMFYICVGCLCKSTPIIPQPPYQNECSVEDTEPNSDVVVRFK